MAAGICLGVFGLFMGLLAGGYLMGHRYCLMLEAARQQVDKCVGIIRLYDAWMMANKNSMGISRYLNGKNISNVAIYGMDYRGIRLFQELKGTSVNVKYGVDRNPPMRIEGLDIRHPDKIEKGGVDAVIVTAIFSFDSIEKDLEGRGFARIFALDEIIYDLL